MAEMAHDAFARLLAIVKSPDQMQVPVGDTFAVVDIDDFDLVSPHAWHLAKGYARAFIAGSRVTMHQLIIGEHSSPEIDHKDGNKLNNRRANLRPCTSQQNAQNRHAVCGKSRFKGVRRDRGYWRAEIKKNGSKVHLGIFPSERLAARAYDKAALQLFGNFAKTNAALGLL